MAQKKRRSGGRATPKGTVDPTRSTKPRRTDLPTASAPPPHEVPGKGGGASRQSHKVARPITHNRGNR